VANKETFHEKIRRLGALVGELDAAPSDQSNAAVRELVQLLMEVNGTALQRIMEIIDESGETGEAIISKAGQDSIVRPLLLLYSLHPEDLGTRVARAIDSAAQRLRKFNSEVELLDICDGGVQVRVRTSGHACGSTTKTVQSIVEECIYDLAPDVTSLEILGQDDEVKPGFVSIESLLKQRFPADALRAERVEAIGAD
jgi:hypothetical protein